MKLKKFADMDDWSAKSDNKPPKIDSDKLINKNSYGYKALDVLAKYGLGIYTINEESYLSANDLCFPREKEFTEYRVNIGTVRNVKDFLDEYMVDSIEELLEETDEDEHEEILAQYEKAQDGNDVEELNQSTTFSIFTKRVSNPNSDAFKAHAMELAIDYINIIDEIGIDRIIRLESTGMIIDHPNELGEVLTSIGINITNDTLSDLIDYSRRFYKDGSFLRNLDESVDADIEKLLEDLQNLDR